MIKNKSKKTNLKTKRKKNIRKQMIGNSLCFCFFKYDYENRLEK